MAKVLENQKITEDFYLMKVETENNADMGQFYMLRAWDRYPVLSRPISVFDADKESVSFLYKIVGQGTEIFKNLKPVGEFESFEHELRLLLAGPCTKRYTFLHHNLQ